MRLHRLPYVTHITTVCGSGVVNDVTKGGHAQSI